MCQSLGCCPQGKKGPWGDANSWERKLLVRKRKTSVVYLCIYVESAKIGTDDYIYKPEIET